MQVDVFYFNIIYQTYQLSFSSLASLFNKKCVSHLAEKNSALFFLSDFMITFLSVFMVVLSGSFHYNLSNLLVFLFIVGISLQLKMQFHILLKNQYIYCLMILLLILLVIIVLAGSFLSPRSELLRGATMSIDRWQQYDIFNIQSSLFLSQPCPTYDN